MSESSTLESTSCADDNLANGTHRVLKTTVVSTHHFSAMVITAGAPITGVVILIPHTIVLSNSSGMLERIFLLAAIFGLFAIGYPRILRNKGAAYVHVAAISNAAYLIRSDDRRFSMTGILPIVAVVLYAINTAVGGANHGALRAPPP